MGFARTVGILPGDASVEPLIQTAIYCTILFWIIISIALFANSGVHDLMPKQGET